MGPDQFEYISMLLRDRSGLVVTRDKMYLLETRLMPIARTHHCRNLDELVALCQDGALRDAIVLDICEAMNTHESLFFRDVKPFELFCERIVPELLKRRAAKKSIRIWCAACSTGQEPYSLAMALDGMAQQLQGWRVDIIATDISHSVLKRAKAGAFSQFEVQRGLPVQMLVKHFTQDGEVWRLSEAIRKMVTFQHFNLLDDPRGLGKFDVVFCRNVLIYFDVPTKGKVMDAIAGVLAEDGVMFLGSSESTMGITEKLWPVQAGRGVYKHTNGPACIAEPG